MPSFAIVDAHVHFYDPGRLNYPWMKRVPALDRPYLPADYAELTQGVEIDSIVFVEVDAATGEHLAEARFIEEQKNAEPRIRGMVASMPLEQGASVERELASYAELPLARGARRLIERHQHEPGWTLRDTFIAGLKLLPKYGLTFDLCLFHHQLREVTELVRRCPEVKFVIDHIAKPAIKDGLRDPWWRELREIAKLPNIWCKVSGVVTEADHARWTDGEVAPYIAHAIDCFGFDRVMFGSDWPVSELATTFQNWIELVDSIVAGTSDNERRRLYRDNATSFYRLSVG